MSQNSNSDIVYSLNVANTNSINELYISYSSTNIGEILGQGNLYDVAVKKVRFPVSSIPLRKRFLDNMYSLSMNVGNSVIGYTQFLLNADSYNGTTYLYSYQNYCEMINAAFSRAFAALKIANPLLISTLAPYIKFNAVTQLFSIVFPNTYVTDNINIYFNNSLNWLFNYNSVRCTLDKYDPFPPSISYPPINDYQITLSGFYVQDSTYNYIQQNYSTTSNLTDFKSFVLQTSMPIIPNQHGTYLNDTIINNGAFSFILAEIEIAGVSQSGSIMWEANAIEWHHILESNPLKKIEVQIFYTNTSDQIFPLPYEMNFSSSVELIFRRIYNRVTCN